MCDATLDNDRPAGFTPPTHEQVHKDIALANAYRLEMSKLVLALAAGLFAFSVAFQPATMPGVDISNLRWGWYALALSMAGGLGNLYGWERFYISYRDYDLKRKFNEGKTYRRTVTVLRRTARIAQLTGFVTGAVLIGYFTAQNIQTAPNDSGCVQQVDGQKG